MSSLQIRVCGRYRLQEKLYEGKYSTVYSGHNVQSQTDCAIKCQQKSLKLGLVINEGKILEEIQGGIGIPNLLWHGQNGDYNFVISQLLGASLMDYFEICGRKFSLKTILMIADKVISCIQFIHYKNIVHRDISPLNFLMGLGKKLHQIYLTDYAFSTPFYDQNKKMHRPDVLNEKSFIGTLKFASLNVQRGHKPSRRDDLQSIGLMLVYFLRRGLPWQLHDEPESLPQCRKQIRKLMEQTSLEQLCLGLPSEFLTFLTYCRKLKYDDQPDYNYLKRIFKEKLIKEGYQYDHIFDWFLIPLKLKDTNISNRIPLNRFVKKQPLDIDMTNADYTFKEDFDFWQDSLKARKVALKEEKEKDKDKDKGIKTQVNDTRAVRSNSTGGKAFKPPSKKDKDCQIY